MFLYLVNECDLDCCIDFLSTIFSNIFYYAMKICGCSSIRNSNNSGNDIYYNTYIDVFYI